MIHPHLKSNEELLSIWNGDFHDIDQMQALEQLARRRVDDFSEQLKLALALPFEMALFFGIGISIILYWKRNEE